ncbi:MAG: sugar ABC transporter permease [Candidatus Bathyarchaeota archaeon]|nr:sugar ABC transporter permease [Candidatus Bathyarchaeota archaeon]MDH5746708.1 sugar ABC transporter permease [Candidatus Bathyarchaeota archaeon]
MKIKLTEARYAYLFLIPTFLVIIIFAFFPITSTFWWSVHELKDKILWTGMPFVGFENYAWAFTNSQVWGSLGYTLYFVALSVTLEFWIGIGMALAMFHTFKLKGVLRAIVIVPWAVPAIIQASMWRWMFHPNVGIISDILVKLGVISAPLNFLGASLLAMHSVILADVWKTSSFMAILLFAGLAAIPQDIYDSAKVDGARGWFRFRHITLPMMLPIILVALLFRTMDAFRVFDLVYGLTGGGPGTTTEVLSTFSYKYYFSYHNFGKGSALAIVTFLILVAISLFYIRSLQKRLKFK